MAKVDVGTEGATSPGAGASPAHPGATHAPRRHHRLRWALLGMVAVLVAGCAVVTLSYAFRSEPGARSLHSATHRFLATTTTAPTPRRFALPVAGVYRAVGAGTQHIDKPPNTEQDSRVMPVTVTYLADGCWRWHIDYNTAAWHEYDFCPHGNRLLLVAQNNYQSWDFGVTSITNLAHFTCNPPSPIVVAAPKVGAVYELHCVGTNTAIGGHSVSRGPVRIVGVSTLTIGGRAVQAIHITRDQVITGAQTGRLDESWWFDAATGLPLRATRNYRLQTASPIGPITYTEVGSWQLASLDPLGERR